MKDHSILAIPALLLVGLFLIIFAKTPAPLAPAVQTTATTTSAIPGDNLTLGEDTSTSTGPYLFGYNGMTVYAYSQDHAGVSACTGDCAATWPPYIVSTTTGLVAEYPIAGRVGTFTRADGSLQVIYNGTPLYFYSGDHASGDTSGARISDWSVVQP